ncbi:MAG: ABC transporter permease [Spirochaetaceae bacterium]|nr:MAG: ABC transporter permease [Spirochaetaceae bacterium]
MRVRSVICILKKDLSVGPRSPIVLFAIVLPVMLTLILQLVFGTLFESPPDFGYVDRGASDVIVELRASESVQLHRFESEDELRDVVRSGRLDAGLILPADFDDEIRAGSRPPLQLYISGESYAVNRLIVTVSSIDAIRSISGAESPVSTEVINLGSDEDISLATRFVPVIAMYAFLIAGMFVPAASLVDERERGTLTAVTVTPASLGDVLAAKLIFGMLLTIVMTLITLWMNNALGTNPTAMILVIVLTSVFWGQLGIIVGLLAGNSQALFAIVKASGALLMAPVIFYLFPDWPQWIASLFPTYWAIDPLWQIMANDAGFPDVIGSVAIVLGMSVILAFSIVVLGRRLSLRHQ